MEACALISRAIEVAAHFHARQADRNGAPYILHPLRVMNAVRTAGFGEDFQIIGVLHDVLEDTQAQLQDFVWLGKRLTTSLVAITRDFEKNPEGLVFNEFGAIIPGPAKETHAEYFERCVKNSITRVVKYYDTLDNMDPRRFTEGVPVGRYAKVLTWYKKNGIEAPPINPF